MTTPELDVANARKRLGNLIASIAAGEVDEVVITRYGKPLAKLVAVDRVTASPVEPEPKPPDHPEEPPGQAAPVPKRPKPSAPPTAAAVEVDDWGLPVGGNEASVKPVQKLEAARYGSVTDLSAADGIKERPSPWDLKYGSKGKKK